MNIVRDSQTANFPVTTKRQQEALEVVRAAGRIGITARELAFAKTDGDVSGVNGWGAPLTVLRQRGVIYALTEKRESHHVYVLPEYLQGRETWSGYRHGSGHCKTCTCEE